MTTLIVNIENKKTEAAIKAVLDALGVDYNIEKNTTTQKKKSDKSEQVLFNSLKKSAEEIKLYKAGKIQLQDANDFLNKL